MGGMQRGGWPHADTRRRCIAAHSAGPTALASGPPNTFAHDASAPCICMEPVVHAGNMRGESGVVDFAKGLRLIFN